MASRAHVGQIDSAARRAKMLFDRGLIQRSSLNLALSRARVLSKEYRGVEETFHGRALEIARESWSTDVADLESAVTAMQVQKRTSEIQSLISDLASALLPGSLSIETWVGESSRKGSFLSSMIGRSEGQVSIVVLSPDRSLLRGPTRGLVAHEVAHYDEEVEQMLGRFQPNILRRGEVMADAFGAAVLGPAFAWALSDLVARGVPAGSSTTHPPWALRARVLRELASHIWEEPDLRDWFLSRLTPAIQQTVPPPSGYRPDAAVCFLDGQNQLARLKRVKMDQTLLRQVRGGGRSSRGLRPILALNSECPA